MRDQSEAVWLRTGGSVFVLTLTWTLVCLVSMGLVITVIAGI